MVHEHVGEGVQLLYQSGRSGTGKEEVRKKGGKREGKRKGKWKEGV